jgi:hypothetical protein
MNKIVLFSLFIFLIVILYGWNNKPKALKAGAICSVDDGDGKFGIVKILVIDNDIAHLRIYKNKYQQRPVSIDSATLSLGSIYDQDGFGVGDTPLDRKAFEDRNPEVIAYEDVTAEELEGYQLWKDNN